MLLDPRGCGTCSGTSWFQLPWDASSTELQIAIKELAPILVAAIIWGHKWKGSIVTAHYDCYATLLHTYQEINKHPRLYLLAIRHMQITMGLQILINATPPPGTSGHPESTFQQSRKSESLPAHHTSHIA